MLKDGVTKPCRGGVERERKLRREMSLPEVLSWQVLRAQPGGLKFRKQHPSGDFTPDFYCGDARLVIEVDGEAHSRGDRPVRDARRDGWFAAHGLKTMRVPAIDVLKNMDGVVRGIVATARGRLPLHHPAAPDGPPPRDKLGEEF